jgi:multiple sugar transport system substrate-binding protein
VSGLYFIPELFQEAGIDEPTNDWEYEDLIDAAVKLTKDLDGDGRTDQWGLWVPPWYESWMTPLRRHGGWPLSDGATESRWLEPETVAGIQFYHDLWYKYKVCPVDNSWAFKQDHIGSAKVGMLQSGLWESKYAGDLLPDGYTFKVVSGVKGPSGFRAGSMGVNFFPIWRSSKHPLEAWEFEKFICSKEVGVENIARIGEPGLRHDVWEDPRVKNDPMVSPHQILIEEAKRFPNPVNGRDSENLDFSNPILDGIRLGELTVEEGCAELHKKVSEVLAMDPPSQA